ncbi:flagellar basal-body MS-ring/collar protein FliF [Gryllotalpicola daejeonensis]|uniref:Flagellar M-ring protein n=1 Tax=Gryllotalpicola daejeonensis TaxID=993087 RepID=A0ABP7ZI81_9MICO
MPAALSSVFRRLGAYFRGFSAAQRTVAIIGVAAVVLGGIALASWLGKPDYAPLFTGLQASDASAIVDQLTSDGVPYQLEDGGSSVLVPQDKVYAERLKAASNSLPSDTTSGYALLDNMGVTTSQFQQDVTYKQAMEEELASTIQAMDGVKTASVKLAIPEQTVFTDEKSDPTASVFVATTGKQDLTDDQVDAIVHLTSASIPDMKPTDVSVVDASGKVLSAVGGTTTDAAGKSQTAYEAKTQQSLQAMLDTIVGPGNSTVAVSTDVNSSTAQQTSTEYSVPTGSPAATESAQSEQYSGSGAGATSAGVLGPDNIAGPTDASGNGSYTNTGSSKTNALNQTTTKTTTPPGAVTRQTVSVAVSQKAAKDVDLNGLTQLVESAAGYNAQRGDIVTVQAVPFSTSAAANAQNALDDAAAQQKAQAQQKLMMNLGLIGGIVLVLIAAIVALVVTRRRRPASSPVLVDEVLDADEMAELLPGLGPQTAPLPDPAPGPGALPETLVMPTVEAASLEARKREVTALAGADPAHTASVLRALMEQEVQI